MIVAKIRGTALARATFPHAGARPVDCWRRWEWALRTKRYPHCFGAYPKYVSYTATPRTRRAKRSVQIKTASRLNLLPPYLFAELGRLKKEVEQNAVDVTGLRIGD